MWNICQIVCVIAMIASLNHLMNRYWSTSGCEIDKTVPEELKDLKGEGYIPSPHHVAVITQPTNRSFLWCGGSLISKNVVLTAAHCLERSDTATIVLNASTHTVDTNAQYTLVSRRLNRHPKWQPNLLLHDLAIIELPHAANLPDLTPIGFPLDGKITSKLATVYGWEKYSESRPNRSKYRVTIINNTECEQHYGPLVTKFTICTRSVGFGNGCHGFSGSGLVVDGLLVGVMSFGTDQCNTKYPTVYSKVSRYRKWIKNNTFKSQ